MDLFFILIAIAVVTSSEMKTIDKLEEELNFLRMKMERMEAKTENITMKVETNINMNEKTRNDTEDRLNYLEEMVKLNVIRTCEEMSEYGITTSNFYFIDPDGPLIGSEPFRVWCSFTDEGLAVTEVLHNSEEMIEVGHCEEPGCYVHPIVYTAPDDQIQSLIQLSQHCEQTVRYDCLLAPLMANEVNFGYWLDKDGKSKIYWDGAHEGQHVCSCFYLEEGCLEQNIKNTTCNCDANVPEMTMDHGTITNRTALPITQLQFGGLVYDMQQAFHSLGRLRCWGEAAYEEGTSCGAIKRSGQYHTGFFNIRKNESSNSQLVFCNQTVTPGYEDDGKNEQFIESSENHFDKVEDDIHILENYISSNEESISTLENDLTNHERKSSFCGYQDDWYGSSISDRVITYDSLLVDDNNIAGASLNTATGQFTAGVNGVYRVEFSIGRIYTYRQYGSVSDIYLRINGAKIQESRLYSDTGVAPSEYDIGGRNMLVNMAKGDKIDVYGVKISDIRYVTFCVSLTK